jgi:S-formylglutathione hydrolase FrmB
MKVLASLLLAFALPPATAQIAPVPTAPPDIVEQRIFFSAALQRDMPYDVVLPADYATSQQRYPVLYLLHGWQGDETNWVKLTHVVQDASGYPLIIITPRAANSWYVNSATHPADRYADYIFTDLIADVDAHYRTIATARDRAIAGLSMGGYGALLFSLRHPGAFAFVASISGAFDGPSGIEDVLPQLKPSTDAAFGPATSSTRRDNNLDALLASADPTLQPYVFVECGTSDPLLASNRRVVAELSARKLGYEYHEYPGAHTWTFWDHSLPMMLQVLSHQLQLAPATTLPSR